MVDYFLNLALQVDGALVRTLNEFLHDFISLGVAFAHLANLMVKFVVFGDDRSLGELLFEGLNFLDIKVQFGAIF